ncbi:MAG: sulfite exporter TauE/SafE family protein [Pirellulaceae bacterium]
MEAWMLLAAVAVVITISGFVQSSMGFGYAVVALAVLPLVLGVREANVVVSLSMVFPLLLAVWAYREGVDWRTMAFCLAGAALGLPLGLWIFSTIDPDWLIRGTGVAILLMSVDGLLRRESHQHKPVSRGWSACAGCASGVLAGSVGMGGPPVAAYAARQPWSPNQFKAFLISFSLVLSVMKAVGLVVAGWTSSTLLLYTAAAIPFGFLGSQLGIVASRNIDAKRFRQITMAVLVLLSLGMIIRGQPGAEESPGPATAHRAAQSSAEPLAKGDGKTLARRLSAGPAGRATRVRSESDSQSHDLQALGRDEP